ncbi:hypothetical protein JCM33374_g4050 [Metschnikowia sp. JCM 33374]|nr:hypothetical protein JCM33374_g4050 [Metschnikowia sp. JCM 33374]
METLPQTGRPIQYDIHDRAVPRSGNCLGTQDILNPYSGTPHAWGWAYQPVGDLSGKHGELYGASAYKLYIDPYLSLNSLNRAFVGGLGLVFHSGWENLDCATITYVRGSSVGGLTAGSGANAGNADKVEVVNGVTEIVGAEYAHETMDLEHVSAELPSLTDDAEFSKETRRPPANAAARTDGGKPRANPGMSKETEKPVGENAPRMKKRYMPA